MVIVDTEFLFALNQNDPKHDQVKIILGKNLKNLKIPTSAIYEYLFVLLSKNKDILTIIESLRIMNDIINEFDIKILEFDINQLIKGLALYNAYNLGLFDCLIAGAALAVKELLIGDDQHFKTIKEIEWKDYNTFLNSI